MLLPNTKYVFKLTTLVMVIRQIKSKTRIFGKDFLCKNESSKERKYPKRKNTPKASLRKLKLKKGEGTNPLGKYVVKSS
jgi:hypothetical protein